MPSRSDQHPRRQAHPLTRAEFARRAGKARSTLTEACQGPLKDACLPGGRIDAAHDAVVAWAMGRGIDPAALLHPAGRPEPAPGLAKAAASVTAQPADPADVSKMLDLTLRQLTDQHGSEQGVADWLDIRKTAAEIVRIEMQNAERAGDLISRELVKTHVFGFIERSHRQLLSDAPKTIASRMMAMVKSGASLEECEKLARDTISQILRVTKDQVVRNLRRKRQKETDASTPEGTPG